MRRRQASRSRSRRSSPPTVTAPRAGSAKPRSSERTVDLPAPFGPTRTTILARRDGEVGAGEHRLGPSRNARSGPRCSATGTRLDSADEVRLAAAGRCAGGPLPGARRRRRTGLARGRSDAIARAAAARPSALSWNSALARRTGQEDLGRDDEHRQRRGRGCTDPLSRRSPRGTASSATETDASVSSTRAERKATRRVDEAGLAAAPRRPRDPRPLLGRAAEGPAARAVPRRRRRYGGRAPRPGASGPPGANAGLRPTRAPKSGKRARTARTMSARDPVEHADRDGQRRSAPRRRGRDPAGSGPT